MSSASLPIVAPGDLRHAWQEALDASSQIAPRLWARDHRLWRDDPTEIRDRLGWLDAPVVSRARLDEFEAIVAAAHEDGFRQAVVVGMGGSSLFPDVLAATHPVRRLRLGILDSTHPDAVRRTVDLPVDETLFVIASKSGSTLETRSHLDALWASRAAALEEPGRAFVAITDPGSELEAIAEGRAFRSVVLNPPDVGGRFSAMTAFGLLPAALLGVDVGRLVEDAAAALAASREPAAATGAAVQLGVLLAVASQQGRDKLTVLLPPAVAPFGAWIEQLVGESLGKDGTSVVPLVDDLEADVVALDVGAMDDRVVVAFGHPPVVEALVHAGHPVMSFPAVGPGDLGSLVVLWELATAVAAAVLGVHPFDQPDVASAKVAAAAVLEAGVSRVDETPLSQALEAVRAGDLVAITAFVDPAGSAARRLDDARRRIQQRTGAATTVGIGPRFLHSTGQLHKGGSDRIVVLQVIEEAAQDLAVADGPTFGTLLAAQAEGDLKALRGAGRRAFRVPLGELLA